MRCSIVLALSAFAAVASAQSNPVDLKLGLSVGDQLGGYAGLDFRLPNLPLRLDVDAYSAFEDFGDRSAGIAATVNYVRPLPIKGVRGAYAGVGLGYLHGRERNDDRDSFAGKVLFGCLVPGTKLGMESSVLWADRPIGRSHMVGTLSLVYRL